MIVWLLGTDLSSYKMLPAIRACVCECASGVVSVQAQQGSSTCTENRWFKHMIQLKNKKKQSPFINRYHFVSLFSCFWPGYSCVLLFPWHCGEFIGQADDAQWSFNEQYIHRVLSTPSILTGCHPGGYQMKQHQIKQHQMKGITADYVELLQHEHPYLLWNLSVLIYAL